MGVNSDGSVNTRLLLRAFCMTGKNDNISEEGSNTKDITKIQHPRRRENRATSCKGILLISFVVELS